MKLQPYSREGNMEAKHWLGKVPTECDLCHEAISGVFIDGKTQMGPWACMCAACHNAFGCDLGLGKGQKYVQQESGQWLKTAG